MSMNLEFLKQAVDKLLAQGCAVRLVINAFAQIEARVSVLINRCDEHLRVKSECKAS
jgi:hypothetical protein